MTGGDQARATGPATRRPGVPSRGVAALVVVLLLLPVLTFSAAASPALLPAAPLRAAPAVPPNMGSAHRAPGSSATWSAFSLPIGVPGLGPRSSPLARAGSARPMVSALGGTSPPAEGPRLPAAPTLTSLYARPAAGPTDINLSGNATVQIAVDTTVRNISLHNNSILYVHSLTIRPTLTVLGNIRLYDRAILFVNSSNLAIGESYDVEWSIQVMGSAQFATIYSNVTTGGYQWGAAYEGNANVTIVSSLVGYPTGWLDSTLISAARLTVLSSWYSSDVILFDNAVAPSTANFSAANSAGFNVWLNFKSGASANISLPGLTGWRNWSFPAAAQVSGVGYTVNVQNCYVLVFAVMLWQGANLTLVNSPDVALSLNIELGTVDLSGLAETHYARFGLYSGLFALDLQNTTMFTWNVYTFSGDARIINSQIGEIQTFGSTWATVHASNLTAHGGYYGDQSSGNLSVFDSRIAGQVVAYSGTTLLENCTINTTTANRVLATGSGHLDALDTRLASVDGYQVLAAGSVDVRWSLHLNATESGVPAVGALIHVAFAANGTAVSTGLSNGTGGWSGPLLSERIVAASTTDFGYNASASLGDSGSLLSVPAPTHVEWLALPIHALVLGTVPSNGTTNVPVGLAGIEVQFADPMSEAVTQGAVSVVPSLTLQPLWDATGRNLTLVPPSAFAYATAYTVTIGAGALTASRLPTTVPIVVVFTTAAAPLVIPALLSTSPANGSQGIAITTNISVTFSVAMNASSVVAAFALTNASGGAAVAGRLAVAGARAVFTPTVSLDPNTTYQVAIAASARSAAGAALAQPIAFTFRTGWTPTSGPPPNVNPGGPSSSPLALEALAALIAIAVLIAAAAALLFRRRGRAGPESGTGAPAEARPPAPAPAWSEEEDPPARPGSPPPPGR